MPGRMLLLRLQQLAHRIQTQTTVGHIYACLHYRQPKVYCTVWCQRLRFFFFPDAGARHLLSAFPESTEVPLASKSSIAQHVELSIRLTEYFCPLDGGLQVE